MLIINSIQYDSIHTVVSKQIKRGHLRKRQLTLHIACRFLIFSLLGWNSVSFPQSLGTVAGGGRQAICCCSSVMDDCKAALVQPKQLFNQTKRLHLPDRPSFLFKVLSATSQNPLTLHTDMHTRAGALVYIAISVHATMAHLFQLKPRPVECH